MDDASEVEAGNLNVLHVGVEKFEEIVLRGLLLGVLHHDAEFVRILGRQIEGEIVAVLQCLNEFEEVNHVDTEHMLNWTVIVLKSVGI